jgi:EAL domain-containing protein (putative c-di-GMP-specific phosphodiesterase class I)/GGDEF domain-containing protein
LRSCGALAGPAAPRDPRLRVELALDSALTRPNGSAACLIVYAEDLDQVTAQAGARGAERAMSQLQDRLLGAVRHADAVEQLEDSSFAIVLAPDRPLDLETLMQIATRVQTAAAEPVTIDACRVRLRASVGLCQSDKVIAATAEKVIEATETALLEARANGSGTIRVYAPAMQARRHDRQALMEEVHQALETGQIRSWFQPQQCTDTGKVSGFEALARWHHPTRGTLSPAVFLPAIEAAGLAERLGEIMLDQSLDALAAWDRAGFCVPCVGVNLSPQDLNNPALADRIAWQIDRFELSPDRLAVEVLESVVAQAPDDAIGRNIAALAALGCHVDLDDFGTGHASITTLRSLSIGRIKIDRSFVTRVDTDREQQKMIATILAMCEHLGLATLAEGVESAGEHAMLAQLGCGHVQGYAIGRPMPFEDTPDWLRAHACTLAKTPSWTRKLG